MTTGLEHPIPDTGVVDTDNPWPGLAAFREADERFFQGRDAVVAELARMVLRARVTVLHGVSGLGKTSLLRAGLFPRLRREHVLPVYVRLAHGEDSAGLTDQVRQALARAASTADVETPDLGRSGTLWELFHRRDALFWDARNRVVTPCVVFDQFEEVFTLGRATLDRRTRTEAFLAELADLVEGRPAPEVRDRLEHSPDEALAFSAHPQPFKLLISLREDFLPDLADLRARMPTVTQTMFRLQPMTTDEALRVIEVGGGHLVDHAVAEQIVRFVASAGSDGGLSGEDVVEPALLSVFCRELNNKRRAQGRPTITADLLEGSRAGIIADFYERTMSEGGVSPAMRVFVEERLLTESGFRDTVAEEHALRAPGVSAADIEVLIARRLLRREDAATRGRARLELTHDVLAGAVRASRDRRRAIESQQRELAERLASEARARRDAEEAAAREQQRREFEAAQALAAKEREAAALAQALAAEEQRARAAAERLARTRQRQVVLQAALIVITTFLAWYAWRQAERATAEHARANRALAAAYVDRVARGEPWPLAYLARAVRHDPDSATARALLLGLLARQVLPVAEAVHDRPVDRAVFNADGTRVLTVAGGAARLWNATTGEIVGDAIGQQQGVALAVFSAGGRRLLTRADDGTARVWEADTGTPVGDPLVHPGGATAAAIARDGERIATGGRDGTVRIWNVAGTYRPLPADEEPVAVLAFDPSDRHLVHLSGDGVLTLQDAASGAAVATMEVAGNPGDFDSAEAFSADGTRMVAVLADGTARILHLGTGRDVILHDGSPIVSAAFAASGDRVVTASLALGEGTGPVARVWDAGTGAPLPSAFQHGDWIATVTFSPDGTHVATGSFDGTARVWDAVTGEPVAAPLRHDRRVVQVSFSPDGLRVLTASEDGTAQLWDAHTGLEWGHPLRHDGPVVGATFSRDGTRVLTASRDGTARVWDARTGVPVATHVRLPRGLAVSLAAVSPDGSLIATAGSLDPSLDDAAREGRRDEEFVARLWDAATAQPVGAPMRHGGLLRSLEFSPRGTPRLLTASADSTARIWDATTGEPAGVPMRHDGPVIAAAFSTDGTRIVTASEDGTARVWDGATGEPHAVPLRHAGTVLSARFSPDGSRVVTASADQTVRLWSTATGEMTGEIADDTASIMSATFSPDGRRILTQSAEHSLLWEVDPFARLGLPLRHEGARNPPLFSRDGTDLVVTSATGAWVWDVRGTPLLRGSLRSDATILSAAFAPDGRLATGAGDGLTRLWDVRTRAEAGVPLRHPGPVSAMTFQPDGARLLTIAADGRARIWDVPVGTRDAADLVARLAEAAGGHVVMDDGTVTRIPDQMARLVALREAASPVAPDGPWAPRFTHWLFADPGIRAISPFSHIAVPDWIARLTAEGESGRREAARHFPGHPALTTHGDGADSAVPPSPR
jgi:WD40 repeat protein